MVNKEVIHNEVLEGNILGVVTTNYNPDKIKMKIVFDYKYRMYRIDVKLKQTNHKKSASEVRKR